MNKKTIYALIIVLLLAAAGFFWWQDKNAVKAYEYNGLIEKVEGSSIFTKGTFVSANHPELQDPKNQQAIEVVVDPMKTKLIKHVLYMPTAEELAKTGGRYEPGKLKSEDVAGSMEDLKSGEVDGVFTKSQKNIYNKSKFTASEVKYIITVYPQ